MTTRTQGLVLAVLAAVLLRLAVTGEYLNFVTPWMRWPLLTTGILLLAMGGSQLLRGAEEQGRARPQSSAPRSAWLLLLPTLLVFAVAPPPLGAFLAERRSDQALVPQEPVRQPSPGSSGPLLLTPGEFAWGAALAEDTMGLAGQRITMSGFVSGDEAGGWYVTRFEISCCAADALVSRVRVDGHAPPPRDQWVEVTGTWLEGTGAEGGTTATVTADQVIEIEAPRRVYD